MDYILIFHANLNYAYLTADKYEFVIRKSYEMILDTMEETFPDVKFVFEASGYTIDEIAARTPDVLEKLNSAIKQGRCEFMGSPYSHPMLPNFPYEDGVMSLKISNDSYRKYLGFEPESFWNPECGWRSYVPKMVKEAGYSYMIGDFEAYSRSCGPDGKPLRPEIYNLEKTDDSAFYSFGFKYDLQGDDESIHYPFNAIQDLEVDELRMFLRTDRIAQFGVRYFMGMQGYTLEKYLDLIKKYSVLKPGSKQGALIIFADDAEYIGTNGWFKLKYQNQPDAVFEHTPDSQEKLIALLKGCSKLGSFTTFAKACSDLPVNKDRIYFDDDSAWHGGKASTWAKTPMAKLLRPWQELVRNKFFAIKDKMSEIEQKNVWLHLTNSYNSDGQWPPTLPDAPHIIHPFNYRFCFDNLLAAETLVGGVDRTKLKSSAVETLEFILKIQQDLIVKKAEKMLEKGTCTKEQVLNILQLINMSRNTRCMDPSSRILYPSEYTVRAEALVKARLSVGQIEIEKVAESLGA